MSQQPPETGAAPAAPLYITSAQAEKILGLAPRRLELARYLREEGWPPFYRFGRQTVRYKLSEVLAWVESRRVDTLMPGPHSNKA